MMHRFMLVALALASCRPTVVPPPAPPERCKESIFLIEAKGHVDCPAGTILHAQVKMGDRPMMLVGCDCPEEKPSTPQSPSAKPDGATKL